MTGLYSVGNGSTTFRLPNIPTYIRGGDAGIQEAGLPNIEGYADWHRNGSADTIRVNGPFNVIVGNASGFGNIGGQKTSARVTFDASRSSPIYGKSNTVEVDSVRGYFQVKAFGRVENMGSIDANNIISEINKVKSDVDVVSKSIPTPTQYQGLGYGQKWVDLTSSRKAGTTYTNDTNKPIFVHVSSGISNNRQTLNFYVDNVRVSHHEMNNSAYGSVTVYAIVPSGSTYRADGYMGNLWSELR